MKRLTSEQVNDIVNSRCIEMNYTLLEPINYINNTTKIHLKCNKDNHEWLVTYDNFINSKRGCQKCSGKLKHNPNDVYNKINIKCKEKNYTLLEPFIYKNKNTKFHLKCNNDNHEWYTTYESFIYFDHNCLKCSGSLKTTQEEAEFKITNICKKKNYTQLEPFIYKNNKNKNIHLKCNKDGYEWYDGYVYLINNDKGCPKCSGCLKTTQEEAECKINDKCKEKNYTLLEPNNYINAHDTIISLKCNNDDYIWNTNYHNFINGHKGCPKCCGNLKTTNEEAYERVNKICLLKNYTLLENFNYTNAIDTKIHLKCNKHNHEWIIQYNNLINNGNSCPKCKNSKGERKIDTFLKEFNFNYETEKTFDECKYINKLRFDFYLPEYNLCIEFDGRQHFIAYKKYGGEEGLRLQKLKDAIKNKYCIDNNIDLLRIPYTEIKNIPIILKTKFKIE